MGAPLQEVENTVFGILNPDVKKDVKVRPKDLFSITVVYSSSSIRLPWPHANS